MHYTVQQLQGGPAYHHKTRIGNWNEDMEISEIKKNDYRDKSGSGQMSFNKTYSKVGHHYSVVPWSHSADGLLRDGDSIMLRNKCVDGHLVADLGVQQNNIDESYRLNTSKVQKGPLSRNVYVVNRVEKADIFGSDNIIRFGQKIKITANQWLHKKVLNLGSTPQSNVIFSAVSRLQEASLHACDSYNTQWIIDSYDPNERFERQGEPVKVGEPILIRHINTGHFLASDMKVLKNDFHVEYEVMCHNFATTYKTQNLELEKKGNITVDVPTKFHHDQNVWMFETAPDASFNRSVEEL